MQTEQINHDPAHAFMNSGSIIKGRPSMGSWLLYGLGARPRTCPASSCSRRAGKTGLQPVSARQWSAGFLPSKFQGIQFQSQGRRRPLHRQPRGRLPEHPAAGDRGDQPAQRPARRGPARPRDPDPDRPVRDGLPDADLGPRADRLRSEPKEILDLYGVKKPGDGSFASNCLLARRLAERGVRFIQLYHRAWDHHSGIEPGMRARRGRRGPRAAGPLQVLVTSAPDRSTSLAAIGMPSSMSPWWSQARW